MTNEKALLLEKELNLNPMAFNELRKEYFRIEEIKRVHRETYQ
ncbi:MAG: hypothetical protein Q9M36_06800 [Sulfurovum sp.]|nr:hypothetical protein [Sulfurovum sp.]